MIRSHPVSRAVAAAALLALAAACTDAPPDAPRMGAAPARATPTAIPWTESSPTERPSASASASAAAHSGPLAALHGRPTDRIGAAHNAAMAAFAADLRAHGAGGRPLCARIEEFLTRMPEAGVSLPTGRARAALAHRSVAAIETCRRPDRSAAAAGTMLHLASAATPMQASTLDDYQYQISGAILNAADAGTLAGQLNDIVSSASQTLVSDEATVVAATANVGQSSFEYWGAAYDDYSASVSSAYGSCFQRYIGYGYADEEIIAACYGGTPRAGDPPVIVNQVRFERRDGGRDRGADGVRDARGTSAANVRFASYGRAARVMRRSGRGGGMRLVRLAAPFCGSTLGRGFHAIAVSDAGGAFVGGMSGIPGGPGGIFAGALFGGAGGSMWTAGRLAFQDFRCAMRD